MRGRDAQQGSVIVGAEVNGGQAASRGFDQLRNPQHGLRRLEHGFDAHACEGLEDFRQLAYLPRLGELGPRDDEVRRNAPGRSGKQNVQKTFQRADAAVSISRSEA